MIELQKELSATTYPGRGIVLGKSEDGKQAVIAYFIMGRSENSRNRIFEADGGRHPHQGVRRKQNGRPLPDHLFARCGCGGISTIVTNGDQTDTDLRGLRSKGIPSKQALRTRTFEPDAPNYTPRISGLWQPKDDCYQPVHLKIAPTEIPIRCQRFFFDYDALPPGRAILSTPTQGDGNPLPSFAGEPTPVTIARRHRHLYRVRCGKA